MTGFIRDQPRCSDHRREVRRVGLTRRKPPGEVRAVENAHTEVFVSHRNAPLSEVGRLRLARCVVEEGWPLRRAAERFQVSATTAGRCAARYRQSGAAGMADRSSRPHRSPQCTPTRVERRIVKLRVSRRWGPARIGFHLGLHPSTVHRVLSRFRLARLAWLERTNGRVVRRYEHAGLLSFWLTGVVSDQAAVAV